LRRFENPDGSDFFSFKKKAPICTTDICAADGREVATGNNERKSERFYFSTEK